LATKPRICPERGAASWGFASAPPSLLHAPCPRAVLGRRGGGQHTTPRPGPGCGVWGVINTPLSKSRLLTIYCLLRLHLSVTQTASGMWMCSQHPAPGYPKVLAAELSYPYPNPRRTECLGRRHASRPARRAKGDGRRRRRRPHHHHHTPHRLSHSLSQHHLPRPLPVPHPLLARARTRGRSEPGEHGRGRGGGEGPRVICCSCRPLPLLISL
jgi:hypothetical protein